MPWEGHAEAAGMSMSANAGIDAEAKVMAGDGADAGANDGVRIAGAGMIVRMVAASVARARQRRAAVRAYVGRSYGSPSAKAAAKPAMRPPMWA